MSKIHQGLPVAGYQPQDALAVALVNKNKAAEETVLRLLDDLETGVENVDRRWLAIARTSIEQGFMAANRAVFKPSRIKLPDDAKITVRFHGQPPYTRNLVPGETWREVVEQAAAALKNGVLISKVECQRWWIDDDNLDVGIDDEIPEHRGQRTLKIVFGDEDGSL